MKIFATAVLGICLFIGFARTAHALEGVASVIDGDTIEIHGQRIRLYGIDAPESRQVCTRNKKPWRCGQLAAAALSDMIRRRPLRCVERDQDQYGRTVAICYLGNRDVNGAMVLMGFALDYPQYSGGRYAGDEAIARRAKRGIWAGQFVKPWEWRHAQGAAVLRSLPRQRSRCVIKGNINSRGERIYHVPGGEYYSRTRIDESKGERWFCSEDEARAAGWRRSRR